MSRASTGKRGGRKVISRRHRPELDDPLAQIDQAHRDVASKASRGLSHVLNLAIPVLALIDPATAAATTIANYLRTSSDPARLESRAEAFRAGFIEAVRDLGDRVEVVERKTAGPEAEEAFTVAMRNALATARLDKARMFGRLLGATVTQDAPNWQEAAEFIRDIEQFSDDDLKGLQLLWRFQRTASIRHLSKSPVPSDWMSPGANHYTNNWTEVMTEVKARGIDDDEWASRCARLMGFGLTLTVPSNAMIQKTDATVFRLTGRGVRLMRLLGRDTHPGAYPSVRYAADGSKKTVHDEDEDKALGDGWADSPAAFLK